MYNLSIWSKNRMVWLQFCETTVYIKNIWNRNSRRAEWDADSVSTSRWRFTCLVSAVNKAVMNINMHYTEVGLGDIAQRIITIIFLISVNIDNITINVKFKFLSNLKPDFCSKEKVVETRPLIFLNIIFINILMNGKLKKQHLFEK